MGEEMLYRDTVWERSVVGVAGTEESEGGRWVGRHTALCIGRLHGSGCGGLGMHWTEVRELLGCIQLELSLLRTLSVGKHTENECQC